MRSLCLLTAALAATTAQSLLAHGPQIQITGGTGQIVTRTLLPDGPYSDSLTAEKSVYVMPVKENIGVWYTRPNGAIHPVTMLPEFYSGPGIAYGYGYDSGNPTDVDFAPGSEIRLGFTDGLKRWSGAAFVDAGPTELEAFRGTFAAPAATARTSDAGPFASLAYAPIDYAAGLESHQTSRFRWLGDGTTPASASPEGVYLVGLQLTSNQQGMESSDPFYFVLHKNADQASIRAAVASLNVAPSLVQFVPEPATTLLPAIGLVGTIAASRRRRN